MKVCLIDFTSRDCKDSSHNLCHGSWQGLGYEVICNCFCHKKSNTSYQEKACIAIMPDNNSYQKDALLGGAREHNMKGTGEPAQHQRNESFSSHPYNPL